MAGPFENAIAAAQRGDYATAVRLWRPLAEQGNAPAQFHLGFMHGMGQGVPQDDMLASCGSTYPLHTATSLPTTLISSLNRCPPTS